jgi:hypothetical protein
MSEYQRYEWMTSDRPLTPAQLDAVRRLSSHIDASSTHGLVEYQWGDFKHDPIEVLHEFFDGFLYWANWGAPELALRFPHGILPIDLLDGYEVEEVVTFMQRADYDLLDIHFGDLEAPDEWADYELRSLIALRQELMDGDLRVLYIVWLASQHMMGSADDESGEIDDIDEHEIAVPPVPPALGALTAAQQALADLLQVPHELLVAAARHSNATPTSTQDDVAGWVALLPAVRRTEYLVRLARHEPGLSRQLVKELRELGQRSQKSLGRSSTSPDLGARVTHTTLLAESRAIRIQWECEQHEQERLARQRQLQQVHEHQDQYWHQVEMAVTRGSGAGYDEATRLLSELRAVAARFQEDTVFQARFQAWVRPHLRRPAFVRRLQARRFPVPDA